MALKIIFSMLLQKCSDLSAVCFNVNFSTRAAGVNVREGGDCPLPRAAAEPAEYSIDVLDLLTVTKSDHRAWITREKPTITNISVYPSFPDTPVRMRLYALCLKNWHHTS